MQADAPPLREAGPMHSGEEEEAPIERSSEVEEAPATVHFADEEPLPPPLTGGSAQPAGGYQYDVSLLMLWLGWCVVTHMLHNINQQLCTTLMVAGFPRTQAAHRGETY
eukprot:4113775-Pyramimonas_sp.AAC.1